MLSFVVVINNINPDCMCDMFKYFSNMSEKPNKILIINVIGVNKFTSNHNSTQKCITITLSNRIYYNNILCCIVERNVTGSNSTKEFQFYQDFKLYRHAITDRISID